MRARTPIGLGSTATTPGTSAGAGRPEKRTLLRMFVRFVNSYRRTNFPQMTLARSKVKDPTNKTDLAGC